MTFGKTRNWLIGLAACALLAAPALAGGITGTIKYDGKVPNLRPVNMNADPTYYLLYQPIDDYLVVKEMSDRPILFVRREE